MIESKLKISDIMRNLYCIYLVLTMCFANLQIFRIVSIIILILMGSLYLIQLIYHKRYSLISVSGLYSLFVLYALISCFWAVSFERSRAVMYEIMTSLLFVVIIAENIHTYKKLCMYMRGFLFATFCMCTTLLIGCRLDIMSLRYSGISIIGLDKNYFSQICAFAVIMGFYQYRLTKNKFYLLNILICILCIIGSGSRKAFLSIGLGISVMYGFAYRKNLKKMLKTFIGLCMIFITVGVYLLKTNYVFLIHILNGFGAFFISNVAGKDTSASIRIALINRARDLFFENPILGVGMNNFSKFSGDINVYGGYMYAHNNYMEILADFGILGFFIYYSTYVLYFNRLKKVKDNHNHFFVALSVSIVVMLLINDIASVSYYLKMYPLFLVVAYKIISIGVEQNEER